ncbi:hypothetical protein CP10139811_1473 [Chlamydia ibidis]|uniref:Uncharacterized protein n=1 Tax=Chlamydia ibidis TaxID=1405396 RepID=S7KLB3_9CHLA|nr:hypothetical protein CP10139811_1473 [Chlamydia ibidis]
MENLPFNPKIMHFLLQNPAFSTKSCIFSPKIPHYPTSHTFSPQKSPI